MLSELIFGDFYNISCKSWRLGGGSQSQGWKVPALSPPVRPGISPRTSHHTCRVRVCRQMRPEERRPRKPSDHKASWIEYVTFQLLHFAPGWSDECFWKGKRAPSLGYTLLLRPTAGHPADSLPPPQGGLLVMFSFKAPRYSLANLLLFSVNGITGHPNVPDRNVEATLASTNHQALLTPHLLNRPWTPPLLSTPAAVLPVQTGVPFSRDSAVASF